MTNNQPTDEPTMAQVIETLAATYRDDGIAIWLSTLHRSGPLQGQIPIDVCRTADGRHRVLAVAESLTGMVAT